MCRGIWLIMAGKAEFYGNSDGVVYFRTLRDVMTTSRSKPNHSAQLEDNLPMAYRV
jgi:hypothetical protein